jgi:hypothetical protein
VNRPPENRAIVAVMPRHAFSELAGYSAPAALLPLIERYESRLRIGSC